MLFDGFDWDAGNWPKCGKHGLSREEIEAVFEEGVVIFDDPHASAAEPRYRGVGRSPSGRMVFVAFCYRRKAGWLFVRPISARYMHRKEIELYERLQGKA